MLQDKWTVSTDDPEQCYTDCNENYGALLRQVADLRILVSELLMKNEELRAQLRNPNSEIEKE